MYREQLDKFMLINIELNECHIISHKGGWLRPNSYHPITIQKYSLGEVKGVLNYKQLADLYPEVLI